MLSKGWCTLPVPLALCLPHWESTTASAHLQVYPKLPYVNPMTPEHAPKLIACLTQAALAIPISTSKFAKSNLQFHVRGKSDIKGHWAFTKAVKCFTAMLLFISCWNLRSIILMLLGLLLQIMAHKLYILKMIFVPTFFKIK